MSKEKYLANIDRVLQDVISKTSSNLANKNQIPYSEELESKGGCKKIAFDVYRVPDDPYNGLWTLEDINGQAYLVRASDPKYEHTDSDNWTVTSNYDKDSVTLSYKKAPITQFSSKNYGFTPEDITTFKSAILDSINDEGFIKDILMEQPEPKRLALLSSFPELKKIIRG